MTDHPTDRERSLSQQIDEQGGQLEQWRDRAIAAEAELARMRAVEPVAPPGWREALQFYADRSHFVIADADAWDTVSGEPSNFWCDNGTATVEDGTVAKMALAGTPLSDEDDDGAAPPAQPAEQQAQTVCKRTLIEIDARLRECSIVGASAADAYDTFYQHMVETALAAQPAEPIEARSRYETAYAGRQLPHTQTTTTEPVQPGWRDIESAPKDGTRIILGSSDGAWMAEYQPVYQSGYRPDNPWFSVMLNHAHMGRFPKAKPTHWQPIPPAPKATK